MTTWTKWTTALLMISAAFFAGCKPAEKNDSEEPGDSPEATDGGHSHTEGEHGGALAVFEGHAFHAELLGDEDTGEVKVLISDAAFEPIDVDAESINLNLVETGAAPQQFELPRSEPVDEVAAYTTTNLELAELACDGWEGSLQISVTINGIPYNAHFASPEGGHEGHDEHDEH
jgi:hypothetical protein